MKIALAQLRPRPGDLAHNTDLHLRKIEEGVARGADLIFFPELSLTGYDSQVASVHATIPEEAPVEQLQQIAEQGDITVGVGFPTLGDGGVRISMLFLRPDGKPLVYSKQYLHESEQEWFVPGSEPVFLRTNEHVIAPAICYESRVPAHAESAARHGADLYLASVASSQSAVERLYGYYPTIARQHSMMVMMANCLGRCDDIMAVGGSAVWSSQGALMARIDGEEEGLLVATLPARSGEPIAEPTRSPH